jgi:hypothetical protein
MQVCARLPMRHRPIKSYFCRSRLRSQRMQRQKPMSRVS